MKLKYPKKIKIGSTNFIMKYDKKGSDIKPILISLDLNWLTNRIGEKIEDKKVINILESLGFSVTKSGDILKVIVPSWRATKDISIPEDFS